MSDAAVVPSRRVRLGFLGAGWIGAARLGALSRLPFVEVVAVADPARTVAEAAAAEHAPGAEVLDGLDALLDRALDGVVIATPSALHAEQALRALREGRAVFCQKPLARTAREARRVVEAARRADRRLGVDFSYRHVRGLDRVREALRAGEAGDVFAAGLVFHNAYGPDKPWYYRASESGGGCVMDLGVHLVDLLFWMLGPVRLAGVTARLFQGGRPLDGGSDAVEDYASARLDLEGGAAADLSCSWRLQAGRDAVIAATFYGTKGGFALENVEGSFYRFRVEAFRSTTRRVLHEDDGAWTGGSAEAWARGLAEGGGFDPAAEDAVRVAEAVDAIYAGGRRYPS